ncbi:cadherin-12 isoform X3 [Papio anubis]|uniref:cadherin-12 isoform X3 n=1 Tax=Cercocebus atys TaxID=9531 RepID=UPI0005F47670|nr:PREDICTED: cadherin-12 isoform X3 [Cercocebus atys]XP_031522577.1 cadherin-12 isoform X3 [Papio anubis]
MLTRNCLSLLLWVLFDGGLLTPLQPQPQQTLATEPRENVIHLPGQRSHFQRVKRGWVWNQFFVLEEYMGSEPQYVGKLHSDLDKGEGTVKYTLSGDGAGTVFTIDETTGDIHAIRSLDREEKPFYTLRAQAVDIETRKPLEPESEFIIKVQDINDNEPKFLDGPYVATVPEMSPVGAYVLQVKATDADDPTYGNSARVVYSILQGQPYFSIDPKTGVIRTALPNMDREVKEQYQVLIQAKDMGGQLGGLAGTTIVNITLTDVNDNPPRFPKSIFHLKVPESSPIGSAIGRIRAVDPDFGQNAEIEYNIVPGDGGNLFDIVTDEDTQEGVIKLKKPLDFETKKAYTFKVEASNLHLDHRFHSAGPFKDTATVKISVLDVDEPPVFSKPLYTMEVYEDTPVGTIIGAVTAQDLDVGSSAVRYFIDWKSDGDSYFTIDGNEGTIATNELLDRESTAQYNFSIIASKVSNPLLTSKVNILINVLDVNEFPPEISVPYETAVCENAKPGQIIQIVSAADRDLSPAGQQFSFRLSPEAAIKPNFTVRDFRTIVVLYVALRRQKKKDTLMTSKEDIRDNVIHYDDEGGGEEDTQAFDIGALRNPKVIEENKIRRDIKPDSLCLPRQRPPVEDNTDIRDFIHQRLQENDVDPTAPPYDSLATYAYEGTGSVAESLSSIDSLTTEADQDYDYLTDWGPRFKVLADMFGEEESYNPDKVT